jgi:hypothetical protein
MAEYTFHYFFLRHLYDSDDKAELKSRVIRAESLSEAEAKFYRAGKHGDLTRQVYEIELNGQKVWTSSGSFLELRGERK